MLRWFLSSLLAISLLLTGCAQAVAPSDTASSSANSAKTTTETKAPQSEAKSDNKTATKADSKSDAKTSTKNETKPSAKSESEKDSKLEAALAKFPQLKGTATVELQLKSGKVIIEVDGDNAPVTAGNFIDLVKKEHYNGLTFHRVVKDPTPFVVQGGDPKGNGTGGFIDPKTGQERNIPLEILPEGSKIPVYGNVLGSATQRPKLRHNKGAVAMARSQSPNSASCQFYIALDDIYFLDGSYAVFGYVKDGMDLVSKIEVGDKIESIRIVNGADNLQEPAA
ncbi:MAG: peptidylprolyl isomerase [Pseudanabaena sp. ELA607]